jgi:hypothetical protein
MLVFGGCFITQASRKLQANFMLAERHQDPLDRDASPTIAKSHNDCGF